MGGTNRMPENVDCIRLAQDRDQWRALVNTGINLQAALNSREFLDQLSHCWLLKKDSAPWS